MPKNVTVTTILIISANPGGTLPLRLEKEARQIKEAILKSPFREQFAVIHYPGARIKDIQGALLEHNNVYLHFCGHGDNDGIALVDDDDNTKLVQSKPLVELLRLFSRNIKCVFMNSCYSISQCRKLSRHIKKTICMNKGIEDELAIHFAEVFYQSLGAGKSIDFSFKLARNSIDLHQLGGSDIPVLLSKTHRRPVA